MGVAYVSFVKALILILITCHFWCTVMPSKVILIVVLRLEVWLYSFALYSGASIVLVCLGVGAIFFDLLLLLTVQGFLVVCHALYAVVWVIKQDKPTL